MKAILSVVFVGLLLDFIPLLGAGEIRISVEDPRPLRAAVRELELALGYPMNYEDPAYTDDDVEDQTHRSYRGPGRLLLPRKGRIDVAVPSSTQVPAKTIQSLIEDHLKRKNPGLFALRPGGPPYTVAPAHNALLDTIISVEPGETTFMGAVLAIAESLTQATGIKVHGPGMLVGPRERFAFSSVGEPARVALQKLFQPRTRQPEPIYVWDLLYAPGYGFVLNIHTVKVRSLRPDGSTTLEQLRAPAQQPD
jgi:hypothetical protein